MSQFIVFRRLPPPVGWVEQSFCRKFGEARKAARQLAQHHGEHNVSVWDLSRPKGDRDVDVFSSEAA